jgi:formylglycine-generating enzyme required for sulfatase activity
VLRHWDFTAGRPDWVAIPFTDGTSATFSAAGEVVDGDPAVLKKQIVYVVQRTPDGPQELLSYDEFQKLVPKSWSEAPSGKATAKAAAKPAPAASKPAGPAPPLAIAPFDGTKAKEHQEAWAKYLGMPVEMANSLGMRFVLIPPGEFDMGSTEAEVAKLVEESKAMKLESAHFERLLAETPKHRVRITKPVYLGQCEVTQAEYERVMGSNPSKCQGDSSRPVEQISWVEASVFCQKLGELPQEKALRAVYRPPTEAEWEYGCRAGTTTTWYATNDVGTVKEQAWFNANAGGTTHPVRQKTPNAWGLCDLHGNVWEWCLDWYGKYASAAVTDPSGPSTGSVRVYRGGSWDFNAILGRSAARRSANPASRFSLLGLRVASVPSGQ